MRQCRLAILCVSLSLSAWSHASETVLLGVDPDGGHDHGQDAGDPELLGQGHGIGHIAQRLRFLLPAIEQETVAENLLRYRQTGAHQECRPVNRMEADNVLSNQVQA